MKFLLFSIISFLIFVGCSLEVQRGIPVDLTKKTMTVPAMGTKLFAIKKELRNAGWKLKIADSSLEEEQTSSKKKVTEVKFNTAYRLYYSSGIKRNSITIVENESDEMVLEFEALNISGEELGERLVEELEKNQ
jgi:type I site-specific restriction endonuclease